MTGSEPTEVLLIQVNGESLEWRPGLRVSELLEELGAVGPGLAVEKNLEVVPRSLHELLPYLTGPEVPVASETA